MNSTNHVSETSSTVNVKEEIDADSVEMVIKVEGECEDIEVDLKVEDEEKPIVCQCEECGSGGRGRVDRCTRAMDWSSSQAIKKEEWEGDDEQSGDMAVKEEGSSRGRVVKAEDDADWAPVKIKREEIEAETGGEAGCRKKAKRTEILVKEEVKEEEDEINMIGPLTQRCGSASADLAIIKFEDNEEITCPCEDCGMVKEEEEGTGSSDNETVVEDGSEDEEDWLPASEGSLGSSSEEEEETDDGPADLMHEPIETVSSTASLEVRPVADADTEQAGPSNSFDQKHSQSHRRRQSSRSGRTSHHSQSSVNDTGDEELDSVRPARQARNARGDKLYRCPQCQKMVTSLTRHLLVHTGQRPHICDQCGRSFTQKGNLDAHLKIHTGEKAFTCDQCGRSFTQKWNLDAHLTVHTGEKAFTCQHCGKCFTQKNSLIVHLKRHNGEKAHQCDQCSSAFVSSYELTSHRRQHTGERPYACPIANCHKAFADQSSLHKHLKRHTGDKRHQCEDCEMRFVTSSELTRHRRHKHSTERPYRCPHSGCNFAAALKGDLNRHLKEKKKHRQ